MPEPKRHVLRLGPPLNQQLFALRWPNGRWELDRHLAPLSCYLPESERQDPKYQLKAPSPELLAGLSDEDKTRFLAACAFARKIQVMPQSNLVLDGPNDGQDAAAPHPKVAQGHAHERPPVAEGPAAVRQVR